jgi:hypothetical protein
MVMGIGVGVMAEPRWEVALIGGVAVSGLLGLERLLGLWHRKRTLRLLEASR